MEASSESSRVSSKVEAVLVFLMHQVIATVIVFFTGTVVIWIVADIPRLIGIRVHQSFVTSATHPPYFPAQVLWAFFLGWSLSGFLRHRTMLWVWILPSLVLGWLFIHFPDCPVLVSRNACIDSPSAYTHFFGPNCIPARSCLYQLYFTLPFLAAVAYSLGALLAQRIGWLGTYAETMRDIRMPRVCMLSLAFICLDLAWGWRQLIRVTHTSLFPAWYMVLLILFPVAMAFVILTYLSMVVISLIGRRFLVTRWFLHQPAVPTEAEPSAQPASNGG